MTQVRGHFWFAKISVEVNKEVRERTPNPPPHGQIEPIKLAVLKVTNKVCLVRQLAGYLNTNESTEILFKLINH